jgi:hypothetical protein
MVGGVCGFRTATHFRSSVSRTSPSRASSWLRCRSSSSSASVSLAVSHGNSPRAFGRNSPNEHRVGEQRVQLLSHEKLVPFPQVPAVHEAACQSRVLEPGGKLDLAEETLGAECMGELGVEHLQRRQAVVPQIASQVDRSPAAPAELRAGVYCQCTSGR